MFNLTLFIYLILEITKRILWWEEVIKSNYKITSKKRLQIRKCRLGFNNDFEKQSKIKSIEYIRLTLNY